MAKNELDPEVGRVMEVGGLVWFAPVSLMFQDKKPSNDDIIELGSRRWRLLPMASGEEDEVGESRWRLLPMAKGSGEL